MKRSPAFRDLVLPLLAASVVAAAAPARADLASQIASALDQAFATIVGTEYQGTTTITYNGVVIDVTLLGMAFCSPSDPWAPPDPSPPAGHTAYGCVNDVQELVTISGDGSAADVALTLDALYVDLATSRSRTLFCGEFGTGTVAGDGYIAGSATVSFTLDLTQGGDCTLGSLRSGSVQAQLGTLTAGFTDGCLASAWPSVEADAAATIEQEVAAASAALIGGVMPAFNDALCGLTPTESLSWGFVKARYGR